MSRVIAVSILVMMALFVPIVDAQDWQVGRNVDEFTDEVSSFVYGFGDGNLMLAVGRLPEKEVRILQREDAVRLRVRRWRDETVVGRLCSWVFAKNE